MKMFAMAVAAAAMLGAGTMNIQAEGAAKRPDGVKREQLKDELQTLKTDVEGLRTARQSHNKDAVKTALEKLKADWAALPPELKERVEKNHPKLFDTIKELRERRAGKKEA